MLAVVPEPTSIENGYRFIKSALFRRLRRAAKGAGAQEIVDAGLRPEEPAGDQNAARPAGRGREGGRRGGGRLRREIAAFQPRFVVNQVRGAGGRAVGHQLVTACARHLGMRADLRGLRRLRRRGVARVRQRRLFSAVAPRGRGRRRRWPNRPRPARRRQPEPSPGEGAQPSRLKWPGNGRAADVLRRAGPADGQPAQGGAGVPVLPGAVRRGGAGHVFAAGARRAGGGARPRARGLRGAARPRAAPGLRPVAGHAALPPRATTARATSPRRRRGRSAAAPCPRRSRTRPRPRRYRFQRPGGAGGAGDRAALRRFREARACRWRRSRTRARSASRYLRYIEDERFDMLPAPVYLRGFLQEYARAVGLEPRAHRRRATCPESRRKRRSRSASDSSRITIAAPRPRALSLTVRPLLRLQGRGPRPPQYITWPAPCTDLCA